MQKRHVVWWMVMLQIICNTLVTLSVDIAIVAMVTPKTENNTEIYCRETFSSRNSSASEDDLHVSSILLKNEGRLHWTDGERSTVLGGFYWFNYLSILPGGILAQKFGSKLIGGYTQLISSAMAALIPAMALYNPMAVAWLRAIQGFLSHMSFPASVNTIVANWCPPQERGKFGALFYAGSAAGQTVGCIAFGCVAQYLSWTYVFYLTSFCGIIWAVFWYLLVHDSPSQHPTITIQEKEYILDSLREATTNTKVRIPWGSIITSVPVIVGTFAGNSIIVVWLVMATYGPTYLQKFYGMETNEIGILTGGSNIAAGVLVFVSAYLIDIIIAKKLLSFTNTRKFAGFLGCTMVSIPLIMMAFTECNYTLVTICVAMITFCSPLPIFGATLSISDMSPAFCGVIQAIGQTSLAMHSSLLVRLVKYANERIDWDPKMIWRMIFLVPTLYMIFTQALYLMFGSSELQPWNFDNDAKKKPPKDSKDLEIKAII